MQVEVMFDLLYAAVTITLFTIGYLHGKKMGKREGEEAGRLRAERILTRAIETRMSPTARQALVCIAGNQSMKQMVDELNSAKEERGRR